MQGPQLPALIDAQVPIRRKQYLAVGLGLGLFKYLVEAAVMFTFSGTWIPPLIYLVPLATVRMRYLQGAPNWVLYAILAWTIPFAFIGVNWSIRRARDAGLAPGWGFLFLVPGLNFLAITVLAIVPTRARPPEQRMLVESERTLWAAATGTVVGAAGVAAVGGVLAVGWSVYVAQQYGFTLFMGLPFVMGAASSFLLHMREERSLSAHWATILSTVGLTGGFLLLFAMEGLLCMAMAAPLAIVMVALGAWLGKGLARLESRYGVIAPAVALPFAVLLEPASPEARVHEVLTQVEIAAPADQVWEAVIAFPEIALEERPEWFFRLGIAYPTQATIDGSGVGAVRRCSFSTGDFVEPITVWDPPQHLAFDVVEQPPTMHEWSPYRKVWAPHLDGAFASQRGEFRLLAQPDGTTLLQGRTWYRFDMEPFGYWQVWSDLLIHRIHRRVLDHVKRVAEG